MLIKKEFKMRSNLFSVLLITLIFSGCSTTKNNEPPQPEKVKAETKTSALKYDENIIKLTFLDKEKMVFFKNVDPPIITNKDLNRIEKILRECIGTYNSDKAESDIISINDYKRYYYGLDNKNERIVQIYCHCFVEESDWNDEETAPFVLDGGKCYFNLKINLETQECFDFFVNGEA